jgi:prevent-host-death family protein
MRRVGAFEAKTHLSQLLSEVERTQRGIVIQRRGKDVAALVPCGSAGAGVDASTRERILTTFREIRESQRKRGFTSANPEEFIEEGRER